MSPELETTSPQRAQNFSRLMRLRRSLSVLGDERAAWPKLVLIWVLLNVTLNARYPEAQALTGWLSPTWEATAILFGYAGVVAMGRRVPRGVHWLIAASLLFARTFRFVDGCYVDIFHRKFRIAIDLPLLPGSVRLLVTTDGLVVTLPKLAGVLLALGLFSGLMLLALYEAERSLSMVLARPGPGAPSMRGAAREHALASRTELRQNPIRGARWASLKTVAPPGIGAHAAAVLLLVLGMVPLSQSKWQDSFSARALSEASFLWNFPEISQRARARFEQVAAHLERMPNDLTALQGRDVTLVIIESYGRGALDTQEFASEIKRALARFEQRLAHSGRSTASRWVLSPSYGGGSWYAHATLSTGVHVWSPLDYKLLLDSDSPSLSRFMSRAGYRTVNVMPGTTQVWPEGVFYGFDVSLYAKDFEYRGPKVGWGRFPDQYVLDQVRRRVSAEVPLFKEIKLVTSHAPWRAVPSVIDDWDSIGDGAVYDSLRIQHFALKWSDLQAAHGPYLTSIIYDLEVLGDYVARFEAKDALVIVLGDHQPVREASLSELWHVPLHISGPDDLVGRFLSQGFEAGLVPAPNSEPLKMQEFLSLFLRALSAG